jgi:cleavage and polyadenylation specificity factor subunit 3
VPISTPRLLAAPKPPPPDTDVKPEPGDESADEDEDEDEATEQAVAQEMVRLHGLGLPVPGFEIRSDKHVAKLWLETMEIECSHAVLRDKLKLTVERFTEAALPLCGPRRR